MKRSDRFWEMREGGPYDAVGGREVFKCIGCGAVSRPKKGWNGEPGHVCAPGCPCAGGDLNVVASAGFRKNFDRIFPNAPGAGI
jgi:hypothetical protein